MIKHCLVRFWSIEAIINDANRFYHRFPLRGVAGMSQAAVILDATLCRGARRLVKIAETPPPCAFHSSDHAARHNNILISTKNKNTTIRIC